MKTSHKGQYRKARKLNAIRRAWDEAFSNADPKGNLMQQAFAKAVQS